MQRTAGDEPKYGQQCEHRIHPAAPVCRSPRHDDDAGECPPAAAPMAQLRLVHHVRAASALSPEPARARRLVCGVLLQLIVTLDYAAIGAATKEFMERAKRADKRQPITSAVVQAEPVIAAVPAVAVVPEPPPARG